MTFLRGTARSCGVDPFIAAQIAAGLALAAALAVGAAIVHRRRLEERQPPAARLFSLWWSGLAAAWAVWAVDTWIVGTARGGHGAAAVADYLLILLYFLVILGAFGSLFAYLLFLYTGRGGVSLAAWIVYGALTLALVALYVLVNPIASHPVTGINDAVFGRYQTTADVLRVLLLLPVLAASLALFLVARKIDEPVARRRVFLLSFSLFLYLLMPLLFPSNPGIAPVDATGWVREVLNKATLLLAIVTLFLAYRPAARLVEEDVRRAQVMSAITQRARELI